MNIKTHQHAKKHSSAHHNNSKTLVVSSTGDIYINSDVDSVCDVIEKENKTPFIIKGERKKVVKAATTTTTKKANEKT